MLRIFNLYVSWRMLVMLGAEAAIITSAVVCSLKIRFWGRSAEFSYYLGLREFALQVAVFVMTFQICSYCCHLYDFNAFRRRIEFFTAVGQAMGAACMVLALLHFIFPDLLLGRRVFFISLILAPVFLVCCRRGLDRIWGKAAPIEHILILGDGPLAEAVGSELSRRNDLNARVAGFFHLSHSMYATAADTQLAPAGLGAQLRNMVERDGISRIVVAVEDRRNVLPVRDLVRLRVQGIRIEEAETTISALTGRVSLQSLKPSWFVFSDGFRRSSVGLVAKRAMDLAAGAAGLLISLPVMALIALAIRIDSTGPAIYRQTRVGFRGRHFELLKFRSMRADAEANGAQWAVDRDPRVTRVGRILRQYRLDELPQWINIIRGDMSLVGPRPERPEFVEELRRKISYYDERHSVRPGLTGWAQVQYRYGSSVEDAIRKMEYDLFYLKNMSIFFDIGILLKTVRVVLAGEGSK